MVEKEVNEFTKKNNIKFKIIRYESILRPIFTSKDIFSKIERLIYDKNNSKSKKLKTFLAKNYIFLPKNGCARKALFKKTGEIY